jgi:hypothetical protein
MGLPTPGWQRLALPALTALVLVASSGCGGGSGGARPSLTARPSLSSSPSLSVPSATRSRTSTPTPTATPTPSQTSTPAPTPSRTSTPAPTRSGQTSTASSTQEPTTAEPTTSEAATQVPTSTGPTATTTAAAETASGGDTSPVWPWVLGLIVLAAALVVVIVAARRRSARQKWTASFETARAESDVLARELAPSLLAGTRESRRGGWEVARPQVMALEDQLTSLARSAHHVPDSTVASELAAAVADVRRTLDDEVRAPEHQATATQRAAHDATERLAARLQVLASPAPGGST